MVDAVRPLIDAWLEADQEAPPKQRHTAKRIFDRLVDEYGYEGKERAVREYVHDWKQAHRSDAIGYLPLTYAPGAEGQCDWGEGQVRVAGIEYTAQLFFLRLAYSLKPFVCAFPTARQECFFTGHEAAFQLFGGVPRRITYDNLTTAVQKVLTGRNRTEQEAFVAFRGHHLFESFFCLPGKDGAHEKSLVETLVGYVRRNFLVPIPDVDLTRFSGSSDLLMMKGHTPTGAGPRFGLCRPDAPLCRVAVGNCHVSISVVGVGFRTAGSGGASAI